MRKTYHATSPNGEQVTRTTERTYTHAIFVRHGESFVAAGTMLAARSRRLRNLKFPVRSDRKIGVSDWYCTGFSGSEELASRAGASECNRYRKDWPSIEVEYRVVPCEIRS